VGVVLRPMLLLFSSFVGGDKLGWPAMGSGWKEMVVSSKECDEGGGGCGC
jgi:hypothetical protein